MACTHLHFQQPPSAPFSSRVDVRGAMPITTCLEASPSSQSRMRVFGCALTQCAHPTVSNSRTRCQHVRWPRNPRLSGESLLRGSTVRCAAEERKDAGQSAWEEWQDLPNLPVLDRGNGNGSAGGDGNTDDGTSLAQALRGDAVRAHP